MLQAQKLEDMGAAELAVQAWHDVDAENPWYLPASQYTHVVDADDAAYLAI